MSVGVVVFPGSNCDRDVRWASEGAWVSRPISLARGEDLVAWMLWCFSGFSYGDYLRCGAIARFAPVLESLWSSPVAVRPWRGNGWCSQTGIALVVPQSFFFVWRRPVEVLQAAGWMKGISLVIGSPCPLPMAKGVTNAVMRRSSSCKTTMPSLSATSTIRMGRWPISLASPTLLATCSA